MIYQKNIIVFMVVFCVSLLAMPFLVVAQTETKNTDVQNKSPENPTENKDIVANTSEKKPAPEADKKPLPIQSIFFSQSDIESILQAKTICEKRRNNNLDQGLEEDDFLKRLESISSEKKVATTFTYPQFFLASILYHSPKDWVVWVNGEKITQNSGVSPSGLKIVEINGQNATFEWVPEQMDKVADVEYSSKNPIKVDAINNKVTFSLKGNQTFTTYAMRIVEGKVPPVTENIQPNN